MGQPLTSERRAQLEAAVNAGNRHDYYSLLAGWGYKYGHLALGVVNNVGASGNYGDSALN